MVHCLKEVGGEPRFEEACGVGTCSGRYGAGRGPLVCRQGTRLEGGVSYVGGFCGRFKCGYAGNGSGGDGSFHCALYCGSFVCWWRPVEEREGSRNVAFVE